MNPNVRPSVWLQLGGGVVLFLATFFNWFGSGSYGVNAWKTDSFGLLGIFVAVMAAATAVLVGLTTFAGTKLPDQVLGLSWSQIYLMFAFTCTVVTLGFLFASNVKAGVFLGLVGSVAMLAGAVMDLRQPAAAPAPPTSF